MISEKLMSSSPSVESSPPSDAARPASPPQEEDATPPDDADFFEIHSLDESVKEALHELVHLTPAHEFVEETSPSSSPSARTKARPSRYGKSSSSRAFAPAAAAACDVARK